MPDFNETSDAGSFLTPVFKASYFFLHYGLFVGAALIGIARYALGVPAGLLALMMVWSVVLLLHDVLTWRRETLTGSGPGKPNDSILKVVSFAAVLNAIMWVMWTLGSEATTAAPLHVTVMIALAAAAISGVIVGKRTLYARWLQDYLRDHPADVEEAKVKRGEGSLQAYQLTDDGELANLFDESSPRRLEDR
jgi:hypothetical protein